jgi:hypothetical protein
MEVLAGPVGQTADNHIRQDQPRMESQEEAPMQIHSDRYHTDKLLLKLGMIVAVVIAVVLQIALK